MASGVKAQDQEQLPRRKRLRYRVQAPVDVTVLRSGVPDTLPGRSVNLGEGGVAAVVAGELQPGEAVGVEIHLPRAAQPLRTRALVRHHDKLRSGMEFVGMSAEQQSVIRQWAEEAKAEPETGVGPASTIHTGKGFKSAAREGTGAQPPVRRRNRLQILALMTIAILLTILWWRWNRGWRELESGLHIHEKTSAPHPEADVPADVMARLVTHRVDPDYPAAARPEKLQGVIVLDVVVGRDGTVLDMHALNGPEILAQAAMAAMRWWRFEPYRVDGRPLVVETTVAVEFKP